MCIKILKEIKLFYLTTIIFRLKKKNQCYIIGVGTQFVMTHEIVLGSHVKGPNNTICREWACEARPWSPDSGLATISHGVYGNLHEGEF